MSVLLGDRKESKFEAITYSIELHDMLLSLMQRSFGVKDVDDFVQKAYAYGDISEETFSVYREIMNSFKKRVSQHASLVTSNVRAANTIYPTTLHEYEIRRDYQNAAIVHCELLIDDLQRVAERFNVDLNLYSPHIKAIDREIGLIKRWRQRDMAIKSRLEKGEHLKNCVVSSANFANVNNNGNTNYNNASNSNGVRPDSSINQRRRRCYPFRKDK